jgi:hypothetical protein
MAVAVVPSPAGAPAGDGEYEAALAGVTRGMREAGVRVRVLALGEVSTRNASVARGSGLNPAGGVAGFGTAGRSAPREEVYYHVTTPFGAYVDAAYLLVVKVTDDEVYRSYDPRGGGGGGNVACRTSGRRMGLRLALLRLPDRGAVWVARGSGEVWEPRRAGPGAAGTVEEDLRGGNLGLYPAPPPQQLVAARLTRRLLHRLPSPVELEPG